MAERSDSKSKQPFTYPIEGRSLTVICNIPSGEYFAHPYEHLILRFVGVGKDIGVTCYNLLLTNPKREKLMNHNIAFLALGDLHLDTAIWRKHRQVTGDPQAALRCLVDLAAELKVPMVLLGDIFDVSDPESSLVQFFRSEMERAHAAGVPVYCIQGNHDKRTVPWYTACSPYPVHVGDGKPVAINGVSCIGYDYCGR